MNKNGSDAPITFNLKQLDPSGGKLILLKRTPALTGEMLQAFADDITRRLNISAVVVAVDKLSDLREMNAADMMRHGWFPKEKIKELEGRLTIALSHLQLLWESAAKLEVLVDMSECPHVEGIGRPIWAIEQIVRQLTPAEKA